MRACPVLLPVITIVVSAILGCGGGGGSATATMDTPSGAVAIFLRAIEKGDVDSYIKVMPTQQRMTVETAREAVGEPYDDTLRTALDSIKGSFAGAKVTSEQINGSRATVMVNLKSGADASIECVKEDDGWKVSMGDSY